MVNGTGKWGSKDPVWTTTEKRRYRLV